MNTINCMVLVLLSAVSVSGCKTPARESAAAYDPLLALSKGAAKVTDFDVVDSQRKRTIPIRIYLPENASPVPVILFSHGLGGSREGSAFLGNHWASRGYGVVFLQHPGSDTSVWKDKPGNQRMEAMREAASGRNFLDRVKDVPAVLDQLERWNKETGHALANKLNLKKVGMSGHSFGAVTTQAVSGQTIMGDKAPFTDPRIAAAVIMSPSSPRRGTTQSAFGKVSLPWMLMTGTKDTFPIGDIDVASRLAVFPALPTGSKYELVLNDAEHSSFTERALPGDKHARNPNHHRAILALSTAFWDAYLLKNTSAKTWLEGDGPKKVLESKDKWRSTGESKTNAVLDTSLVPGVVVDHSPKSSGKYIGSPSIAILPTGDYVASHDYFGPRSNSRTNATSVVFSSADKGKSWNKIATITPLFWGKLFVHKDALYILGTRHEYGDMLIRRSTDNGKTWTAPSDAATGLLRKGTFHCAPCQTLLHNNRIWRSMEVYTGGPWGNFEALVSRSISPFL